MTKYLFTPTINQNYSFQPTIDGKECNVIITWSLFARRWIVNIFDLQNNRIFTTPAISSDASYKIDMLKNVFSSSLTYDSDSNTFEVLP